MFALINIVNGNLDEKSLTTFLCETASIINNRPLSADDLSDLSNFLPISPSNFLTMKPSIVLAPHGYFSEDNLYSRKRWRRVQHLSSQFWLKYRTEYLQKVEKSRQSLVQI